MIRCIKLCRYAFGPVGRALDLIADAAGHT
jgi:hypothetical protein